MPPHRLSDLNIQQLDTRLCLLGFLSLCLTIEMRLLTRLCKITMINEICTYFLSCNIPTILLIQSVRCACVISTYIMYALPTSPKSGTSKWPMQEQPIYFFAACNLSMCNWEILHGQENPRDRAIPSISNGAWMTEENYNREDIERWLSERLV